MKEIVPSRVQVARDRFSKQWKHIVHDRLGKGSTLKQAREYADDCVMTAMEEIGHKYS